MQPTLFVISDLHLGPGRDAATGEWNILEDFRDDESLCAFLRETGQSPRPVELVIAGDFIEYPQILPDIALNSPEDRLGCSEAESIERTAVLLGQRPDIASGHPLVFAALREFMMHGHSITIIPGNHDIDLLWDGVWAMFFDAIYPPGAPGTLRLVPFSYTVGSAETGRVVIQHGHEHDVANAFGDEMRAPFGHDRYGICRLKRCWGTLFVDKVYNRLESRYRFIDNVKPMSKVIKMGLQNDAFFTAPAVLSIILFVFTSKAPLREFVSANLSAEEALLSNRRDLDELVATIEDPTLQDYLTRMAQEHPADYANLADALATMDDGDWQDIRAGAADQHTLDEETAAEEPTATLGGGGSDPYTRSVRAILEQDAHAETVIFGHTHSAIDGLPSPIYLPDGRQGYYFNTGTWTQRLRETDRPLLWDDLSVESNYVSVKTYITLVPDASGRYAAQMHNWE